MLDKLYQVVDYFVQEYDMTNAEVVGVLEIMKSSIILDCLEDEGSEGDNSGGQFQAD
jgi:hypothetical protein